jgi:polar amino acid transport system substrate-binding protein
VKKVKAVIVFILVLTLLCGCAYRLRESVNARAVPVLDRILDKGELLVGTSGSQPPLSATTKEGKIIGLDADLATIMAATMNVKLKLVPMPFSELLPALEKGKVDMIISGMGITPERNLKVAFVGPYLVSGKSVLAKSETIASLENVSDINRPNFTVAALEGSTSQLFVKNALPRARLFATKNLDEAVEMVIEDKVNALIADYPFCAVTAFRYRDKSMATVDTPYTYEPLGIALPANDPLLVNWVENFLASLEGSGDLSRLRARWFLDGSWISKLP